MNSLKAPPCFNTDVLIPDLKIVESVGSTNEEAKKLLQDGAEEGQIFLAYAQTSGVGRKGRHWLSPEGGLYFSIVLKPRLGLSTAPMFNLLCACSVCKALRHLGISGAQVKWPNDILVGDAKISGILSEVVTSPHEGIVVGIGVNLNVRLSDMPSGLQWPTTSVIDELGIETSVIDLLCSIVNEIDFYLAQVDNTQSYTTVLDDWRALSGTLGQRVRVYEEGRVIEGLAVDISQSGALIVETKEGQIEVLLGDVAHLRATK